MQISDKSGGEEANEAFVEWMTDHPDGYVVNERGNEPPTLHRASCLHFKYGPDDDVSLTRQRKYVDEDRQRLLDSLPSGTSVVRCVTCGP